MNKITAKLFAAVLASAVSLGSAQSVGAYAKKTDKGSDLKITASDIAAGKKTNIKGKTLKWMGFYDLNPTKDNPERDLPVALFEDVYGAKIKYMPTTYSNQFDDLAVSIIGGNSPDIFSFSERTFPYDINRGMFQPIDSVVDWKAPMWAEVKDQADMFKWKGKHYVAPYGYSANDFQLLMYNRSELKRLGIKDPYKLYKEGKWDWNTFTKMMNRFTEKKGDGSYGIGGWWANALVYSSGDPIVKYNGKSFKNNINSPSVKKAQAVIENIKENDMAKQGWISPMDAFADGDLLFYSMGAWAFDSAAAGVPDDEVFLVPFPKKPGSDTYYMRKSILSYMWVKGSKNADAVKAWFNVNRFVFYDDRCVQAEKEKFLKNYPNWSEEAYDVLLSCYDDDKLKFAYDYGYGLSDYMNSTVMPDLYEGIANDMFESWQQAKEEYSSIVASEIEAYN